MVNKITADGSALSHTMAFSAKRKSYLFQRQLLEEFLLNLGQILRRKEKNQRTYYLPFGEKNECIFNSPFNIKIKKLCV